MEDFAQNPAQTGNTMSPQVSTSEFGSPSPYPKDNADAYDSESRKLQDLLAQEVIELAEAETEEAFARAEQVLAAHRMRFQRIQQGKKAVLDVLASLGLTVQDIGWTEKVKDQPGESKPKQPAQPSTSASDDDQDEAADDDQYEVVEDEQGDEPQPPKTQPTGKGLKHGKRVVQVLKGSNPKVFYSTGRVPKEGLGKGGKKDEGKWRLARADEKAEFLAFLKAKPKR